MKWQEKSYLLPTCLWMLCTRIEQRKNKKNNCYGFMTPLQLRNHFTRKGQNGNLIKLYHIMTTKEPPLKDLLELEIESLEHVISVKIKVTRTVSAP